MTMRELLDHAVGLETAVWQALVTGDGAADEAALTEDFLGVYPTGFADRSDHVGQLIDGPTVSSFTIVDPEVRQVADGVLLLAYDARYRRIPGRPLEQMYVSSLWVRTGDGWRNVFSQDTPGVVPDDPADDPGDEPNGGPVAPRPTVRDRTPDDEAWVRATLEAGWGSTAVARLGELVDAADLPGLVAEYDGMPAGLATYAVGNDGDDGVELVSLQALTEGVGIGRALLDAVLDRAIAAGATRLWLSTTNDNLRAIGVYQRWGFDLARLVTDGVAASRRLKPQIPEHGTDGIPVRHELIFERRLDG